MKEHSRRKFLLLAPFAIAAFLAVFTAAVYWLWNGVLTPVLGVTTITFWQALGLLVLAKILFGGFPGRGRHRCGPPWRHRRWMRHWESLTPEQREQWRAEMRDRFGDWPHHPCCGDEPEAPATPPPAKP